MCGAGCKVERYCGRECQLKHWKRGGHKAVCRATAEAIKTESAPLSGVHKGGCQLAETTATMLNADPAQQPLDSLYQTPIPPQRNAICIFASVNVHTPKDLDTHFSYIAKVHSQTNFERFAATLTTTTAEMKVKYDNTDEALVVAV